MGRLAPPCSAPGRSWRARGPPPFEPRRIPGGRLVVVRLINGELLPGPSARARRSRRSRPQYPAPDPPRWRSRRRGRTSGPALTSSRKSDPSSARSAPAVPAVTVAVRGIRAEQADLAEDLARSHRPEVLAATGRSAPRDGRTPRAVPAPVPPRSRFGHPRHLEPPLLDQVEAVGHVALADHDRPAATRTGPASPPSPPSAAAGTPAKSGRPARRGARGRRPSEPGPRRAAEAAMTAPDQRRPRRSRCRTQPAPDPRPRRRPDREQERPAGEGDHGDRPEDAESAAADAVRHDPLEDRRAGHLDQRLPAAATAIATIATPSAGANPSAARPTA